MKQIIILSLILMVSCSKEDNYDCCTVISASFEFHVVDEAGNDLLNPNGENRMSLTETNVYYILEGEREYVYSGYSLRESQEEGLKTRFVLDLNIEDTSNTTTTLVEWNDDSVDTFTAQFDRFGDSAIKQKVWLNGTLVWSLEDEDGPPYFELIK